MSREPEPERHIQAVGIATKREEIKKNTRYPSLSTGSFLNDATGRGEVKKKKKLTDALSAREEPIRIPTCAMCHLHPNGKAEENQRQREKGGVQLD